MSKSKEDQINDYIISQPHRNREYGMVKTAIEFGMSLQFKDSEKAAGEEMEGKIIRKICDWHPNTEIGEFYTECPDCGYLVIPVNSTIAAVGQADELAENHARQTWGKFYDDIADYGTDQSNGEISKKDFLAGFTVGVQSREQFAGEFAEWLWLGGWKWFPDRKKWYCQHKIQIRTTQELIELFKSKNKSNG